MWGEMAMADKQTETSSQKTLHDQLNRSGVTNGVPDRPDDEEATALPNSDREKTEHAGAQDG
jgi:hypothetical protein